MSVAKRFFKYTSLNSLAMVGNSLYILADTFFISLAQGERGLTALNLVLPIYSLIFAVGAMLGTGYATRFVILRERSDSRSERCFSSAIVFAVLFGAVFMLVGGLFPSRVVQLMGGSPDIVAVGTGYTRIFMLFSPCFMLNFVMSAFVRNDGAPSVAMAGMLTGSISNIFLDYLFMFPLGLGMEGAALATGVSPIISVLICSLHFFSKKCTLKFRIGAPTMLWQASRLGVAAFVGEVSGGIITTVFNFIVLGIAGNTGVAAYGVIANFAIVATGMFNGIAQGSQPLVSEYYGAGKMDNARKVLRMGVGSAAVLSAVLLAVVMLLAEPMVGLFNSEGSAELAALAEQGIRLYFIGFVMAGYNIISTAYLSASEKAVSAFVVAVLRGFAAVIVFAFVMSALWGMTGVWLAFPAAELLTAVVSFVALRKSKKTE